MEKDETAELERRRRREERHRRRRSSAHTATIQAAVSLPSLTPQPSCADLTRTGCGDSCPWRIGRCRRSGCRWSTRGYSSTRCGCWGASSLAACCAPCRSLVEEMVGLMSCTCTCTYATCTRVPHRMTVRKVIGARGRCSQPSPAARTESSSLN